MSRKYKFYNPKGIYFVSFATVNWIDVFTRRCYKDILVDSLRYCQTHKSLELYAWVIMTNHVHLIMGSTKQDLAGLVRDLKKHTSKQIIKNMAENPQGSRKEWMLWMFERAGKRNSNNQNYQFWQQHNHPIELTNPTIVTQKLACLHQNPVEAGFVSEPEDYWYSSAKDYAGQKVFLDLIFI